MRKNLTKDEKCDVAIAMIRDICFELDSFAYLLRNNGHQSLPRVKAENLHYGTGTILARFVRRLRSMADDLEGTRKSIHPKGYERK